MCSSLKHLNAHFLTSRANPDTAANVLLAVVGMVCAPDPFVGSSHVTSSGQSDEWSQEALLHATVELLIALLDSPVRDLRSHSILKPLFQVDTLIP